MNLPIPFVEYTRRLLGVDTFEQLAVALNEVPPVSIRFNSKKVVNSTINKESVPWSTQGFYLDERLTFTFDPLFHAGCYYVQEASSMFVEQVLRNYTSVEPLKMLDLCAAPGGKSTHARSVLPSGSLLVANEVMRNRSQILAENLIKWGYPDVVVTNNDPSDFTQLTSYFDVILTDVPCSGEGMFRKDAVAIDEWSEENVDTCWQRQRRIIKDIWPALKPGGILIYSTCTYNTLENEENVQWILDNFEAEALTIPTKDDWNITGNLLQGAEFPVYRFMPSRTRGEGFFLAAIRKADDDSFAEVKYKKENKKNNKNKKSSNKKSSNNDKELLAKASRWLNDADQYSLTIDDVSIKAIPTNYINDIELLKSTLRVINSGINIAEIKGNDLIPHHALAMSCECNFDAFESIELSYEQAIAYLRKEAINLPPSTSKGFILLTYKNTPIGFVKNIGNRANNLYPQEWRIRSGYLPEEIKTI